MARDPSSSTSAPPLELRQDRRPDAGLTLNAVAAFVLVWTVGGFGYYHSATGSWTVGAGQGEVSDAAMLLWIAPMAVWGVVMAIGPRGRLARLWHPAARVTLDQDGISWDVDGTAGRAEWAQVGKVNSCWSMRRAETLEIRDLAARVVGRVPREVKTLDGRRYFLVDLIAYTRPDLFEVDGSDAVRVGDG